MHASDARAMLDALAAEHAEAGTAGDVQVLLDALAEWQVLDRSYDGTRAANLAEYRNRHYVYQFTQAGYRAYRAVEDVLGASLEDAQLSRLVFPDILADLVTLAEAARTSDAAEVYRKLSRLDGVLADMAQRAARFYLMLGDLARTNDTRPEVFLAQGRAAHPHARVPLRAVPVLPVAGRCRRGGRRDRRRPDRRAGGRGRRAALPRSRRARRRLAAPLGRAASGSAPAPAARPSGCRTPRSPGSRTSPRCSAKVTESRRGGVSRESQLRHLAQWFASAPADADAHALFQAVFGLGAPRHVSASYDDPDADPGPAVVVEARAGGRCPGRWSAPAGGRRCTALGQIQRNEEKKAAAACRAAQGDRAAARGRRAAGERRRGTTRVLERAGDPGAARPAGRGAGGAGPGQPDRSTGVPGPVATGFGRARGPPHPAPGGLCDHRAHRTGEASSRWPPAGGDRPRQAPGRPGAS